MRLMMKNYRLSLLVMCVLHLTPEVYSACSLRVPTSMCLFTKELPLVKKRFMPSIGNGYIASIVMSNTIHVAGVYNGKSNVTFSSSNRVPFGRDASSSSRRNLFLRSPEKWYRYHREVAHRARVPSTAAINLTLDVPGARSYALDLENGVFYQWFDSGTVHVEHKIYAHRIRENLIINEISLQGSTGFNFQFISNSGVKSKDISFRTANLSSLSFDAAVGSIKQPEMRFRTKVATVWTRMPQGVQVYKPAEKKTYRFITSISSNLHATDPLVTATHAWREASVLPDLFTPHADKWKSLWKDANVSLTGDLYLSQLVPASLYYTLSQVNERFPHGVSPGGLAGGEEYLGHVFWDQDIWMYPSLLMLHPHIARSLLEYRQKRLQAAKQIALKYKYRGAMYPWESALTGFEVCPEHVYGLHEIHINGDIAFAQRQYFYATNDITWLREKGYDVIYQTATFWASRVEFDQLHDRYVINDVMPPDEYAYPVNNSIYTNTIAKLNLEIAIELGRLLKVSTPAVWKEIASKMYLPFDNTLQYHPEYENFDITKDTVKQADTILINYPLMVDLSKQVKKNDLTFYASVTNPNGPAMTHSMFAIGWLDLGNATNAAQSFKRNFENVKGPFRVWSELRSGDGATNFMTGAGGFLQSVIFGYGGLRLKIDGLHFNLQLPPGTNQLALNGVKYLGNSLQFEILASGCFVNVIRYSPSQPKQLYLEYAGKAVRLSRYRKVYTCNGKIYQKGNQSVKHSRNSAELIQL